jgi:hypothetical protein
MDALLKITEKIFNNVFIEINNRFMVEYVIEALKKLPS